MDTDKQLAKLSIDEKIRLLTGVGDWHTYGANGKVPVVMMTDGPHGLRKIENEKTGDMESSKPATCFPTASAVAAGWNPKLAALMGQAIAREAKAEQISVVLGCGINIKRSPLGGRNFEYFSEDPFLTGELAAAYIKGAQSEGVGTSLKHFAVNSQETRRMTSNSQVDERALREIYLSAFERVVKDAKPTTVMASYNRINGEYGCRNTHLLRDILYGEWGYEGGVVSDWGACNDVIACLRAGMTLEMPDARGYHTEVIKKAYEAGEVSEKEIDTWAGRVLKVFAGLHDNLVPDYRVDYDEQHAVARMIEDECAVLLKNDGILPISVDKRLVIVGELAEHMRIQGGGSSHINPTKEINAVEALKEAGFEVVYLKGYRCDTDKADPALEQQALDVLGQRFDKEKDVVLFFLGLTNAYEGEGYDRENLEIPSNQPALLEKISDKVGKESIAAISFGGAPINCGFDEHVNALLHMYLGGQAVGEAVADIVSGRVNPSGRLAETFPLDVNDVPSRRYFAPPYDDVEYRESVFVGYRYYETFAVPVKYPFGYGLSYTQFAYSDLTISEAAAGNQFRVSCRVKNTGAAAGAEVVQLYVKPQREHILRSSIELRGFQKVFLNPGEEAEIELFLDERCFSVYDEQKKRFIVLNGTYQIVVGASVKDIRLEQCVEITNGEQYYRNEREQFPDYFRPQPHGMEIAEEQFARLLGRPPAADKYKARGDFTRYDSFADVSACSLFGKVLQGIAAIGLRVMFAGKAKDDPVRKMVKMGLYEGNLEGLISTSGGLLSPKIVDMLVYNANREYGKAVLRIFRK